MSDGFKINANGNARARHSCVESYVRLQHNYLHAIVLDGSRLIMGRQTDSYQECVVIYLELNIDCIGLH